MLHLVDLCPIDGSDPVENALSITRELERFSATLAQRERWLVLNKADLLTEDEIAWVDDYHAKTRALLAPQLEGDDLAWVQRETRSL